MNVIGMVMATIIQQGIFPVLDYILQRRVGFRLVLIKSVTNEISLKEPKQKYLNSSSF